MFSPIFLFIIFFPPNIIRPRRFGKFSELWQQMPRTSGNLSVYRVGTNLATPFSLEMLAIPRNVRAARHSLFFRRSGRNYSFSRNMKNVRENRYLLLLRCFFRTQAIDRSLFGGQNYIFVYLLRFVFADTLDM